MDIYEFAVDFPDLYQKLDQDIENVIQMSQMSGDSSLREWDEMVDEIVNRHEEDETDENMINMPMPGMMTGQQHNRRGGGWDRNRNRGRQQHRHRRRRDVDLRDLTRVLFLRRLFDCDRCR